MSFQIPPNCFLCTFLNFSSWFSPNLRVILKLHTYSSPACFCQEFLTPFWDKSPSRGFSCLPLQPHLLTTPPSQLTLHGETLGVPHQDPHSPTLWYLSSYSSTAWNTFPSLRAHFSFSLEILLTSAGKPSFYSVSQLSASPLCSHNYLLS